MIGFFLVALAGGSVGGMLALGGVLISTPLFELLPVDGGHLSFAEIGSVNLLLVMASALVASVTHHKSGYIDNALVWRIGPPLAAGGFLGAILSGSLPDSILRLAFGVLAGAALVISGVGARMQRNNLVDAGGRSLTDLSAAQRTALRGTSGLTGVLSGLVGAGGGFIMTPVLISIVRIPPKAVVGSMSLIGGFVILGNLAGRSSQLLDIAPSVAAVVVVGAALGGALGASAVRRISPNTIRRLVFVLIGANALRSITLAVIDLA